MHIQKSVSPVSEPSQQLPLLLLLLLLCMRVCAYVCGCACAFCASCRRHSCVSVAQLFVELQPRLKKKKDSSKGSYYPFRGVLKADPTRPPAGAACSGAQHHFNQHLSSSSACAQSLISTALQENCKTFCAWPTADFKVIFVNSKFSSFFGFIWLFKLPIKFMRIHRKHAYAMLASICVLLPQRTSCV